MRIIGGTARGTNLFTLEGMNTRPTLDRVKESFFNIIQNDIVNSVFVDLFSGSGAIGLEAASRGAKKVILCDKSKDAVKVINKNIEKTHLSEKVKLYNLDYENLLKQKIKEELNQSIDFIYIDPPYESNYAVNALKIIINDIDNANNQLVDQNTRIIIETDNEEKIISELEKMDVEIVDKRKYGRAILIFVKIRKG